jgi:uncharacterized iron-regulated protein
MPRRLFASVGLITTLALGGCASPPESPGLSPLADLTTYLLVDPATGSAVTVSAAAARLADADVVFLGESHRHPGNHLAQMALFRALHENREDLALSLEQFERDVQPVLDQYLAGDIGEATLRDKGRVWDNYRVSYRPLVEYAKANGLPVIAAEVPNMVVRCVGRQGPDFLDTLPAGKRQWAAARLRLNDGPYKDRFMAFASGSGSHGEPDGESDEISEAVLRSFAAQVTRDETMAESIVTHIEAHPGRQVVHLNGSFHSAAFLGTAERVAWSRPDLKIAVVHPIEVEDPGVPAIPQDKLGEGTFLLLIAPTPEAYVSEQEEIEAVMAQMKFREAVDCEL